MPKNTFFSGLGAVPNSVASSINLLGYNKELKFHKSSQVKDGIDVILPNMAEVQYLTVAWTLAIERKSEADENVKIFIEV